MIERVTQDALRRGLSSAVVTFDRCPHPVVGVGSAPNVLTDLSQKLELLASERVDRVVVVHFDPERSAESAEDFVREVRVG